MNENRTTVSTADLEPNTGNAPMAAKEVARPDPPYDLHVHSVRKRLADIDGISAKAAIDGLVKAGIIGDDSAKWIRKISYSQEKGAKEKTIITITSEEKQ